MLDLNQFRNHPDDIDHALKRRGLPPVAAGIMRLDEAHRSASTRLQQLQARRNEASRLIGLGKGKGEDVSSLLAEVAVIKEEMPRLEEEVGMLGQDIENQLARLPNLPAADVPDGLTPDDNREVRRWGEPPSFAFAPKQHFELGEALGLMDFETAATLSGARFVLLRGDLARLERALGNFMLDLHTQEFGYIEMQPPLLVRESALFGTGNLPKHAEDVFVTTTGHWLIPTAEVPLTNLGANRIVDERQLPLRATAWTPCFRSEAGAAGKDTRGMIRQHQFYKVELVSLTHPDTSEAEHERMTACAEEVLRRLQLPYRVMLLCAGDMGFAARKTYDIEVWLPGQNQYREISSCSNCGDFQARRMKARFREPGQKGTRLLHSLNGSGVAVGRCLIAVLENNQEADGSIRIPDVLRSYMNGQEVISPQ